MEGERSGHFHTPLQHMMLCMCLLAHADVSWNARKMTVGGKSYWPQSLMPYVAYTISDLTAAHCLPCILGVRGLAADHRAGAATYIDSLIHSGMCSTGAHPDLVFGPLQSLCTCTGVSIG